jgi:FkbM family methyltransferase
MLIDLKYLIEKYSLNINGVIHAGAHYGQEVEIYKSCGINYFILFEPSKKAFEVLEERLKDEERKVLVNCALGARHTTAMLNVEKRNQGQSNSILGPKKHLEYYPDITFSETEIIDMLPLDHFKISWFNFLVMDVQGYELEVLKGAINTLEYIDYIYTEVNTEELYEGCALMWQMDNYLKNFKRVETKLTRHGWGDALYIRS